MRRALWGILPPKVEASMPRKVYIVELTTEEKAELLELTRKGKVSARKIKRANILLQADKGKTDLEIAENLEVGKATGERTRKKFVEGGLEWALNERHRPGGKLKLDSTQEAFLVALAGSEPPAGRERWTMQLLADRLVQLGMVDSISDETVRRTLKKRSANPG
jgi:transposase